MSDAHVILKTTVAQNPEPARNRLRSLIGDVAPVIPKVLVAIIVEYLPVDSLLPPDAPYPIAKRTTGRVNAMLEENQSFWFRFQYEDASKINRIYYMRITPSWSWFMIWNEIVHYFKFGNIQAQYCALKDQPRRICESSLRWLRLVHAGHVTSSYMGFHAAQDSEWQLNWSILHDTWAHVMRQESVLRLNALGWFARSFGDDRTELMNSSFASHIVYTLKLSDFPQQTVHEAYQFYLWPLSTRNFVASEALKSRK